VSRFAFNDSPGRDDFRKAQQKYKTSDWAQVKHWCEDAIARDPMHLDAHWLLAGALAQTGDLAGAVEHVDIAIAADDYHYAPLLTTTDLKPLMASPYGKMVADLDARIAAEYARRAAAELLVVARDQPPLRVTPAGTHAAPPRGEVYAYDQPTRRYLRLSHTDHAVAGFVRGPSGAIAMLGYDRVDRSKDDADPPQLAHGWVLVISPDGKKLGEPVVLPTARQLSLGYGAGDQLVAGVAQAVDRWRLADPTALAVDVAAAKVAPIAGPLPVDRIAITADDGELLRAPDAEVHATWNGGLAPSLEVGGDAIAVPESGQATAAGLAVARDKAHVALVTFVDPCGKAALPSLYVADTKAKSLHHIVTAASRFDARWLDNATLAYEDGDAIVRLSDAESGREVGRLDDRAGIALDVLSPAPGPLCKADGAAPLPAGSAAPVGSAAGSAEPMPPEETPAAPTNP
jgi:hypothetical protein